MLKEKVKNTIIFLFILNALFLTGKIWFNEKLWSSDYNFFVFKGVESFFADHWKKAETYSMPKESLSRPRKIVINSGSEMTVYYNSDPAFSSINDSLRAMLLPVLEGKAQAEKTTADEWFEALSARSVYAEYSLSYPPELFSQILGVEESAAISALSSVRDFMIAPRAEGGADLYMRAADSSRFLKFALSAKPSDFSFLDRSSGAENLYFFAFDLGLSAADENAPKPPVLLSPMVLISAEPISAARIYSKNPMLDASGALEGDTVSRILSRFDASPRTSRNYTDSNGTQVYVENTGTVKLYRDGMIEYTALSGDGIPVKENTGNSLYAALNSTIDFVEEVWAGALPNQTINACVSGDLASARLSDNTFRFTFDYYVAGNPVQTDISASYGHAAMNSAVEVLISGGKIVEYRHFVRQFREEGTAELVPMIEALNKILAEETPTNETRMIDDMYLSYVEDGSGKELLPRWFVRFSNSTQSAT